MKTWEIRYRRVRLVSGQVVSTDDVCSFEETAESWGAAMEQADKKIADARATATWQLESVLEKTDE